MYKLLINSLGTKLLIYSDVDLFPLFDKMGIYCHLPDMQVINNFNGDCQYNLYYSNNSKRNFKYDGNDIYVNYPLEEISGGHGLLYIAGPLLEKQRQLNHSLTCHAACISKENKGILLLGSKGSGKTTMVLRMLLNGYSLVSNDICVIDYSNHQNILALGGTKFLNIRQTVLEERIPEIKRRLSQNDFSNKSNIIINPNDVHFKLEHETVPIVAAFILYVDNNMENSVLKSGDDLTSKLYVSENFSRYIRGVSNYFINSQTGLIEGYIPSLDNSKLYEERENFINDFVNFPYFGRLSGNMLDIEKRLVKRI